MSSVQRRVCRGESGEGWADVGDLLVSWGHGGYLSWMAAKTHGLPMSGYTVLLHQVFVDTLDS